MKDCIFIAIYYSKLFQHYTGPLPTCQRIVQRTRRRSMPPCGPSRLLLASTFCKPWSWLDSLTCVNAVIYFSTIMLNILLLCHCHYGCHLCCPNFCHRYPLTGMHLTMRLVVAAWTPGCCCYPHCGRCRWLHWKHLWKEARALAVLVVIIVVVVVVIVTILIFVIIIEFTHPPSAWNASDQGWLLLKKTRSASSL